MSAPICPYCSRQSELVDSIVIYRRASYGTIYLCSPCNAYVGCHKGTTEPLGRLANAELREWKKRAHAAFDPIWERAIEAVIAERGYAPKGIKHQERGKAYADLGAALGIPIEDCHIGMFDVDQCKAVVDFAQKNKSAMT